MAFEELKKRLEVEGGAEVQEVPESKYPPVWTYTEGDYIVGKVTRIDEPLEERIVTEIDGEGTENGQKFTGKRTLWLSAVLQREFEDQDIKVGDEVGIKYLGLKKGKKWKYHSFRVIKGG